MSDYVNIEVEETEFIHIAASCTLVTISDHGTISNCYDGNNPFKNHCCKDCPSIFSIIN